MAHYSNASGKRNDPRPVKDKGYIRESVRRLYRFLVSRGYDMEISLEKLTTPSSKMFWSIFCFMISILDPGQVVGDSVDHELFISILSDYGYPFTIHKSWLQSVGAPLTWPHILATLSYLRERIEMQDEYDVCF